MDFVLTLILVVLGAIIGGMFGRWVQRKIWLLDRPYAERQEIGR